MTTLPPSVYVARLRRAFFLRVHPDQFRSHEASVRQQQARLVQALNDRLSRQDFLSYNYGGRPSVGPPPGRHCGGALQYVVEHRDGTLQKHSLLLDDSVESILENMRKALIETGAASLPPPPKWEYNPSDGVDDSDDTVWGTNDNPPRNGSAANPNRRNIDHRFNINTTKGRDLLAFCETLLANREQIEVRRQERMAANTAAMMGRRLFKFSSIDGTNLYWSSKSFTILLHSLIKLHEEHHSKFRVQSFYPLRLVFSNHDYGSEQALDLYGGNLHLNPSSTPLQWLEVLRKVTDERLEVFQKYRAAMEQAQSKCQSSLGVRFKKGFTSSAEGYYHFVLNFANSLPDPNNNGADDLVASTTSIALEPIQVICEALEFRRAVITNEGDLRVGVGMSFDKVLSGIRNHSASARERREHDRNSREISDRQARKVQIDLGLTKKVYKAGIVRIRHDEFQNALRRILQLDSDQKEQLRHSLSGNALGLAGSGQFCHLGDDGAVIIPYDWSLQGERTSTAFSGL